MIVKQLSSPTAAMLSTEARPEEQTKHPLPDTFLAAQAGPYRRAIIGKRDQTLHPMIPAGSIVSIDTAERAISTRKDWTHEFQRPIYFLKTQDEYVYGWCQLDHRSDMLTLIPHPLSPASSRRWKYRTEIENVGRVVAVAIRRAE